MAIINIEINGVVNVMASEDGAAGGVPVEVGGVGVVGRTGEPPGIGEVGEVGTVGIETVAGAGLVDGPIVLVGAIVFVGPEVSLGAGVAGGPLTTGLATAVGAVGATAVGVVGATGGAETGDNPSSAVATENAVTAPAESATMIRAPFLVCAISPTIPPERVSFHV